MNRIVLVTGASKGLGASIAKQFLDDGDIVYINYQNSKKKALLLSKKYSKAYPIKCDIRNEKEVKKMITTIKKQHGYLDIIINNAGISHDSPIQDKTSQLFMDTLKVNLIGSFLVSKYGSMIMDKGCIINISSNNGIDAYYPESIDYDASKSALISLTHNLAQAYAPNIRVNAIAPGWINTDMTSNLEKNFKIKEENKILLQRFAEPEEIAKVVFFIASNEASYVNDSIIRVDGGLKC